VGGKGTVLELQLGIFGQPETVLVYGPLLLWRDVGVEDSLALAHGGELLVALGWVTCFDGEAAGYEVISFTEAWIFVMSPDIVMLATQLDGVVFVFVVDWLIFD
jgi:hypothetical protein